MSKPESVFLAAFGKIVELGQLDSFIWATLRGWGALTGIKSFMKAVQPPIQEVDPESQAKDLAQRLKQEEEDLKLIKFADDEAGKDYPYLLALVSVRLWAMAEAAAREVVVEALRKPSGPPDCSKLRRLKGPIGQFVGADADTQTDLLADVLWQSPQGRYRGIERFDAVLELIGLGGSAPPTINEILTELSQLRHCVVHREGLIDRRFLEACPWIGLKAGSRLPTSLRRYWFHRNATYWYVLELVRRWARWQKIPALVQLADQMDAVVLDELKPAWATEKRIIAS